MKKNIKRTGKEIIKASFNSFYPIFLYKTLIRAKNTYLTFEFEVFKAQILHYLYAQKNVDNLYSFASNKDKTDIYSNTYALMLYGLLGEIDTVNTENTFEYIYSRQTSDGFFRDKKLQTDKAETGQGWGWQHLAPHIIIAFDYLNRRPKYEFNYIIEKFSKQTMFDWLSSLDWDDNYLLTSNYIMNVGVLLQYSRDCFHNDVSKKLSDDLKEWLINEKFDLNTIMKNIEINKSKYEISKAVKTIYHIAPLYVFDDESSKLPIQTILDFTLKTQNKIGGFGPNVLTDACEDIDSLYLLTELGSKNNQLIQKSVKQFFQYIFINQNRDGGLSFKKYKAFSYGSQRILSSNRNESNLFATWFRTLSIAFACEYLDIPNKFYFSKCPGYQFQR